MIIGLCGKKTVGKDTMADYIVTKYGYKKSSLADPLKNACRALFNFTDEQLYGKDKETVDYRWGVSPRTMFQFLGTEVFREHIKVVMPHIGNDFWIKSFKNGYKGNNVVIADVRFMNEADAVRELGGIVIKINRNGDHNDGHASEVELENIVGDYVLDNNGTLEEYYKNIDKIIKEIKI